MVLSWQRHVTLPQLQVFLAAARERDGTPAVEELALSQNLASAQLHELERLVGQPLFEQVGERCVLTRAGHLLTAYAHRVLAAAEEAANALVCLHQGEPERLLVATSTTAGTYLLPHMLGPFCVHYPSVQLVLELKRSTEICDDVRTGRIELGIIECTSEHVDDALLLTPFYEDELLLIVPSGHPWVGLGEVPLDFLTKATLLWTAPGSDARSAVETVLHRTGIRPGATMQIGDMEAIKRAVMARLGVAILPQAAVSIEVTAGLLASVRLADVPLRQTYYLVSRSGKHLSPLTRLLLLLLLGKWETGTPNE